MAPRVTSRTPFLLGVIIAVGPVSTDMYLPAFPALAHDLHDLAAPQYSLGAYFAGLALGQMTQGTLADRLGRRGPLLVGLALYTLATLGCLLSWNTESLVVFRFLTALGASAGVVIPRAMVRDLADGPEAARLFSKLMLVMGVAPIAAPMLGAAVVEVASWRMIFALCALYGVVALALIWWCVPDTLPVERRARSGLVATLARYGAILRERGFITHAIAGAATSGCIFAYLAATPQVFEGEFGWSVAGYAALFGANSAAYIAVNQINPPLMQRVGLAKVVGGAALVQLAAGAGMALCGVLGGGALVLAALLLLAEIGFGLLMPCTLVGALSRHQAHAGSASALMGTLQYGAGALTSLGVGVLADGTARPLGFTMLGCAALGALAAALRPRLVFAPAE
jgi:DHA1 family bicyclomycin/chloramphenicol resistance-like MFS transporter